MKILVVSGFLGAGKTTFIRALTEATGQDFAVYENELGGSGIDAEALRRDELSVWESTENCICCTGSSDFANAVLTISNAIDPEFLVVEPSGAAKLGALLETIGRVCYEHIALLRPVTLVDCRAYASQRAAAPELWADQISSAGTLVCTKGENLLPAELTALTALLRELNPTAEVLTEPYSSAPAEWWHSLLTTPAEKLRQAKSSAEQENIEQLTLSPAELPSPAHLVSLLDDIVRGEYGLIMRAKGIVRCGGQCCRFDVVQQTWSVTGAESGADTSAVFIGQALRRSALRRRILRQTEATRHDLRRRLTSGSKQGSRRQVK
ncbi:MAG: GTP-binding protein [Oscillospiraceae bacterium]|nr:GTP-binding protein [Oscillospiraceae bacterium]